MPPNHWLLSVGDQPPRRVSTKRYRADRLSPETDGRGPKTSNWFGLRVPLSRRDIVGAVSKGSRLVTLAHQKEWTSWRTL